MTDIAKYSACITFADNNQLIGSGSMLVYRDSVYLVTNQHVIDKAGQRDYILIHFLGLNGNHIIQKMPADFIRGKRNIDGTYPYGEDFAFCSLEHKAWMVLDKTVTTAANTALKLIFFGCPQKLNEQAADVNADAKCRWAATTHAAAVSNSILSNELFICRFTDFTTDYSMDEQMLGLSGSGLYTDDGKLVGIVKGRPDVRKEEDNEFVAIKITHITEAIDRSFQSTANPQDWTNLPLPLSPNYYGRESLFDSVIKGIESNKSAICVYGDIGEGKTAFAFHLLNRLSQKQYCGAEYVHYWEFPSSYVDDNIIDGTNQFLEVLANKLGIPALSDGQSEEQKVKAICDYTMKKKVLLILDGDGIDVLARESASEATVNRTINNLIKTFMINAGKSGSLLLLLSKREFNLLNYYSNAENIQMPKLSEEDCISIMKDEGISERDALLLDTVKAFESNPLAITMFSRYIVNNFGGKIIEDSRSVINSFLSLDKSTDISIKVQRFVSSCLNVFPPNTIERKVLNVLSIFRHPISYETFLNLADCINYLSDYKNQFSNYKTDIIKSLRKKGLMSVEESKQLSIIPVVKENVFNWFRKNLTTDFQQTCEKIANYCIQYYDREHVTDVKDMGLIYDAIFYLTLAQKYNAAIDLFWDEVCRHRQFFSQKKLGVISDDLFVISLFFDSKKGWELKSDISNEDATWLYSVGAYLMNNIGALSESEMLRKKEIEIYKENGNDVFYILDTMHLARNLMMQCRFKEAEDYFRPLLTMISEGNLQCVPNRYSKAINVENMKAKVKIRYAFLNYLHGSSYYSTAKEMLTNEDTSETGRWNYYIIKSAVEKNRKEQKKLMQEVECYLQNTKNAGLVYEISYAYITKAVLQFNFFFSKEHKSLCKYLDKQKASQIMENINNAIRYAEKVWRMEQYPFVLIQAANILINMFEVLRDKLYLNKIEECFLKVDTAFHYCSIPLYKVLYAIERLRFAYIMKDGKKAESILNSEFDNLEARKFFYNRINAITKKYKGDKNAH